MDPLRIVRCICGTFQTEIDMGDFSKQIALQTCMKKSHSRGVAIVIKSGILMGYNIDIERPIEYNTPYQESKNSRKQWQSQVDVIYSNHDETILALIEYESTDLYEDSINSKLEKWECFYPNPEILLLCVIIVNLYKHKVENIWEIKDRTELVNIARKGLQKINNKFPDNSFSVISLDDNAIKYHFYYHKNEQSQSYDVNWQ